MKKFVVSRMNMIDAEPVVVAEFSFTRHGRKTAEFIMRNYEAVGIPARVDVRES